MNKQILFCTISWLSFLNVAYAQPLNLSMTCGVVGHVTILEVPSNARKKKAFIHSLIVTKHGPGMLTVTPFLRSARQLAENNFTELATMHPFSVSGADQSYVFPLVPPIVVKGGDALEFTCEGEKAHISFRGCFGGRVDCSNLGKEQVPWLNF